MTTSASWQSAGARCTLIQAVKASISAFSLILLAEDQQITDRSWSLKISVMLDLVPPQCPAEKMPAKDTTL